MTDITNTDRGILRDLAKRVADIADDPVMDSRRRAWIAHNSLRSIYPMMLVYPEGSWSEILPDSVLRCADSGNRKIERELRMRIYGYKHFADDAVVEKQWGVSKYNITNTGWGIEPKRIASPDERGAWHFDPVIKEASDLKKLRYPEISYNENSAIRHFAYMQELFGDILTVTLQGVKYISYHLMREYTALRGLEETMIDLYAEPEMLRDAMAFLEEGHRRVQKQYAELGLLSFNNDNTYQNSGGNGYTDELPLPDASPEHARPQDMWASAEAQEMAQVSPAHHAEFVLEHEKRLLTPFGLTGYGCCEDLTQKLELVFTIPHIRRISISPWADVDICGEKLKGDYIFSWKPNPAHLVGQFSGDAIRNYIRHTIGVAKTHGCVLEIILKDTHTCEQHPERFDEWTRIAREVIVKEAGDLPNRPDTDAALWRRQCRAVR